MRILKICIFSCILFIACKKDKEEIIPNSAFKIVKLPGGGEPLLSFNNELYVASGTKLAKYQGDSLKIIHLRFERDNLYHDLPNDLSFPCTVYNNKVFFAGRDSVNCFLYAYDGNSCTKYNYEITNSSVGFTGWPIIFNGSLYFQCLNGLYILAKYENDNSISFNYCQFEHPFVFGDNMFFKSGGTLKKHDGVNITGLSFNGTYEGFPILFNGMIYLKYHDYADHRSYLSKFDGTSIQYIKNTEGHDYYGYPVIYRNELYFGYSKSSINYLAKLSNDSIKLIPNIDNDDYGFMSSPIVYKDRLFFIYKKSDGTKVSKRYAFYDGTSITLMQNPDDYYDCTGFPVIHNGTLYISYNHNLAKVSW